MIDPKQKAEELVGVFWKAPQYHNEIICTESAKDCAKIAVNEIIDVLDKEGYDDEDAKIIYWQEVLNELNKNVKL